MTAAAAGVAAPPQSPPTATKAPPVLKLAKRKVALFVAYVGSSFRGLQLHPKEPGGTVEDVLQEAIYKMGGILPSNYGNLHKVGWSRSSRTDKGVHALANVLAMKLECHPASFEEDPEGIWLAEAINAHLPREVCVLSVQRVNGGFNARNSSQTRSYNYYLPASILAPQGDDPLDPARMVLLRECCRLYEGNHPFHNYTKRKLYRLQAMQPRSVQSRGARDRESDQSESVQAHSAQPAAGVPQETTSAAAPSPETAHVSHGSALHSASKSASGNSSEEDDWEVVSAPQQEGAAEGVSAQQLSGQQNQSGDTAHGASTSSQQEPDGDFQMRSRPLQYKWQDEMDPSDRLAAAHYRYIKSITVHDPAPLGPANEMAVKITITGNSFMLHQIRHMLGAAVAVARGTLPLDFVAASLCAPARTALPLAPPQVLVLADNTFQPFPRDGTGAPATASATSGDVLQLRQQGQAAQSSFEQEVLNPAMAELLKDKVWEEWDKRLSTICWQSGELALFLEKGQAWRQHRAVSRAEQDLIAQQQIA